MKVKVKNVRKEFTHVDNDDDDDDNVGVQCEGETEPVAQVMYAGNEEKIGSIKNM